MHLMGALHLGSNCMHPFPYQMMCEESYHVQVSINFTLHGNQSHSGHRHKI